MKTKQTNRSVFRLTWNSATANPSLRGHNSSSVFLSPLVQTAFLCRLQALKVPPEQQLPPRLNTGSGDTPTTYNSPGKTGICQNTSKSCAGGTYISSYCLGDSSIMCCPDASTFAPSPTTCKPPGNIGVCQSTSNSCAGAAYILG